MKSALRIFLVITVFMPVLVYGGNRNDVKINKIQKVVIDPGHGGRHPGCVHKNMLEKDVTLSIGLKLGELIKKNFPDVTVVYTRKADTFVGLLERSAMANKAGADLFISIHINSTENPDANGLETYIMGVSKTEENLKVAMKENDAVVYEDDYSTKYEGYVPGDPTSLIMFSLMQSANRDQSLRLAEIIQKHMAGDLPMRDRGVREAAFLVLYKAAMPSVLVEVGYMSNKKDREYITANKGQSEAARSIFNAFSEYKSRVEGRSGVIFLKESAAESSLPDITSQLTPEQKAQVDAAKREGGRPDVSRQAKPSSASVSPHPSEGKKYYIQIATLGKPKNVNDGAFKSYRGKVTEVKSPDGAYKYLVGGFDTYAEAAERLKQAQREFKDAIVVSIDGEPLKQAQPNPQSSADSHRQPPEPKPSSDASESKDDVLFYVQIASLSKPKSINDAAFKSCRGKVVEKRFPGGTYRYFVGGYADYAETLRLLNEVRREFKDAFIVAFRGNDQISVDDARRNK